MNHKDGAGTANRTDEMEEQLLVEDGSNIGAPYTAGPLNNALQLVLGLEGTHEILGLGQLDAVTRVDGTMVSGKLRDGVIAFSAEPSALSTKANAPHSLPGQIESTAPGGMSDFSEFNRLDQRSVGGKDSKSESSPALRPAVSAVVAGVPDRAADAPSRRQRCAVRNSNLLRRAAFQLR